MLSLDHLWKRLRFAFTVWLQDPTLYPLETYPPFDIDLCARMFLRNQTILHWHARSIGAQALTYLQPFNGFGARSMSPSDAANSSHLRRRVSADGTTELDAICGFYRRLAADFQRQQDDAFIDLTTVFDQAPSNIYIDQVHCSDVGYDLMARRIAEDILKREGVTAKAVME